MRYLVCVILYIAAMLQQQNPSTILRFETNPEESLLIMHPVTSDQIADNIESKTKLKQLKKAVMYSAKVSSKDSEPKERVVSNHEIKINPEYNDDDSLGEIVGSIPPRMFDDANGFKFTQKGLCADCARYSLDKSFKRTKFMEFATRVTRSMQEDVSPHEFISNVLTRCNEDKQESEEVANIVNDITKSLSTMIIGAKKAEGNKKLDEKINDIKAKLNSIRENSPQQMPNNTFNRIGTFSLAYANSILNAIKSKPAVPNEEIMEMMSVAKFCVKLSSAMLGDNCELSDSLNTAESHLSDAIKECFSAQFVQHCNAASSIDTEVSEDAESSIHELDGLEGLNLDIFDDIIGPENLDNSILQSCKNACSTALGKFFGQTNFLGLSPAAIASFSYYATSIIYTLNLEIANNLRSRILEGVDTSHLPLFQDIARNISSTTPDLGHASNYSITEYAMNVIAESLANGALQNITPSEIEQTRRLVSNFIKNVDGVDKSLAFNTDYTAFGASAIMIMQVVAAKYMDFKTKNGNIEKDRKYEELSKMNDLDNQQIAYDLTSHYINSDTTVGSSKGAFVPDRSLDPSHSAQKASATTAAATAAVNVGLNPLIGGFAASALTQRVVRNAGDEESRSDMFGNIEQDKTASFYYDCVASGLLSVPLAISSLTDVISKENPLFQSIVNFSFFMFANATNNLKSSDTQNINATHNTQTLAMLRYAFLNPSQVVDEVRLNDLERMYPDAYRQHLAPIINAHLIKVRKLTPKEAKEQESKRYKEKIFTALSSVLQLATTASYATSWLVDVGPEMEEFLKYSKLMAMFLIPLCGSMAQHYSVSTQSQSTSSLHGALKSSVFPQLCGVISYASYNFNIPPELVKIINRLTFALGTALNILLMNEIYGRSDISKDNKTLSLIAASIVEQVFGITKEVHEGFDKNQRAQLKSLCEAVSGMIQTIVANPDLMATLTGMSKMNSQNAARQSEQLTADAKQKITEKKEENAALSRQIDPEKAKEASAVELMRIINELQRKRAEIAGPSPLSMVFNESVLQAFGLSSEQSERDSRVNSSPDDLESRLIENLRNIFETKLREHNVNLASIIPICKVATVEAQSQGSSMPSADDGARASWPDQAQSLNCKAQTQAERLNKSRQRKFDNPQLVRV